MGPYCREDPTKPLKYTTVWRPCHTQPHYHRGTSPPNALRADRAQLLLGASSAPPPNPAEQWPACWTLTNASRSNSSTLPVKCWHQVLVQHDQSSPFRFQISRLHQLSSQLFCKALIHGQLRVGTKQVPAEPKLPAISYNQPPASRATSQDDIMDGPVWPERYQRNTAGPDFCCSQGTA